MLKNIKRSISVLLAGTVLAGTIIGCGAGSGSLDEKGEISVDEMNFEADMSGITTGSLEAGSSVHDPSVIADNGKYYIVGSHMTFAYSDDLRKWTLKGNGYTSTNMIFGSL